MTFQSKRRPVPLALCMGTKDPDNNVCEILRIKATLLRRGPVTCWGTTGGGRV